MEEKWGIRIFHSLDELLKYTSPTFVVLSVPRSVNPAFIKQFADRGMPVLSETPPAADLPGLIDLDCYVKKKTVKIQVAEQYHLQPLHAARIAIANSGKLGIVSQAHVSAAHECHGISLLRKLLAIGFEDAKIVAQRFVSPIVTGPDRQGPPVEEKISSSVQEIAWLNFEGKMGVYDFTGDQYFSWIRSQNILVRGDKGEISGNQVRYLKDFRTPIHLELQRLNAGESGILEGLYHKGIIAGEEWVYKNPFVPGRPTDDEIVIAVSLLKMDEYAMGVRVFTASLKRRRTTIWL